MNIKDEFVLDNSVTMSWCFPDEQDPYALDVLKALPKASAAVPTIWHLEVANILLVGERRSRITQSDSATFLGILGSLPIAVDGETTDHAFGGILSLSRAQNLSAYDAAYLELAMRRGLPLAALDGKLKTAAAAVGVPLYVAS